jgi:hypothetical protein
MIDGFLYLLQRDHHSTHRQYIYILGQTNDFNIHINECPLDSPIIPVWMIDNEKKGERELIREFTSEYEF